MIQKFRIDIYIHSCKSIEELIFKIQKRFVLKQDSFKHLFKKYYIKNTFVLNRALKLYFNFGENTNYVYMSIENFSINFENYIKLAYELYDFLQKYYPIQIKLSNYINSSGEKISYYYFEQLLKEFYQDTSV